MFGSSGRARSSCSGLRFDFVALEKPRHRDLEAEVTAKDSGMIDQTEFNVLNDCDKWRYYRDATDKLAAHIALDRKYAASLEVIDAAKELIDILSDCDARSKIDSFTAQPFVLALNKFQKETERGDDG